MTPAISLAKAEYFYRGYLSAKALYNTRDAQENTGQRHRAQFEQESRFSSDLVFINQVRWSYSSLFTDLSSTASSDAKDTHEVFLGDNFFKYKASSWVIQTGYQEVAWGEAFGFNYADVVNPKDSRETFYSDLSEARLPLFLVNFKYFFSNGSIQLIYSPEPKFSKGLPVNIYTAGVLSQTTVNSTKEKGPSFFKENEYGGKLAVSFWGLDASIFYFSYLDRDPTYKLISAGLTTIELAESHERINSTGLSLAKTLFDNFVFRTDIVYTQDKRINSLTATGLTHTPVNMTNLVASLDTPSYHNFSAALVYATSSISEDIPNAFREQKLNYSIAKISYDFGEEKVFDLSYTHEWSKNGHGLQGQITWPVNDSLDIRFGAENYWGGNKAQLAKIKNVSNVFFGIKNYFQL